MPPIENPFYQFLKGKYRTTNLVDKLPYADLVEGVVFNEFGWAEFGFEVELDSPVLATPEAVTTRLEGYHQLLKQGIPQGERGRFYIEFGGESGRRIEQYAESIRTPQPILREVLDSRVERLRQRQAEGSIREWRIFFTCTVGYGRRRTPEHTPEGYAWIMRRAQASAKRIESLLERADMNPRRLDDQGCFELMRRYVNVGSAEHRQPRYIPVHERPPLPKKGVPRDYPSLPRQLASSFWDTTNASYLQIGDRYVFTVVFSGTPARNQAGMIGKMLSGLFERTGWLVMDFLHEDIVNVRKRLGKAEERASFLATIEGIGRDITQANKAANLGEAVVHLENTGDHTYQFGVALVVTCRDRHEVESAKNQAISTSDALVGAWPFCNGIQHPFVFLNALPLSGQMSDFRVQLVESDAVSFAPYSLASRGAQEPFMLFRNKHDALTAVNLLDPGLKNLNGCILSPTGGGKTYTVQVFAAHLLNSGCEVMILEHGENYKSFTEAYGGSFISMRPDDGEVYNPFDLEEGQNAPDPDQLTFLNAWIRAALPAFENPGDEATRERVLRQAIEAVYAQATVRSRAPEGGVSTHYQGTTLSDLREYVGMMRELEGRRITAPEQAVVSALVGQLSNWTGKSTNGRLFDGKSTVRIQPNQVLYFSTWGLDGNEVLRAAATLYMNHLMWRRCTRERERPKRIFADEVWAALKHPATRDLILGFLRRGRTFNTGTFVINNSLEDLRGIPGLIESLSLIFIGESKGVEQHYLGMFEDFTPATIEAIRNLKRRSGEYADFLSWVRTDKRVLAEVLRIDAVPMEYWVNTTTAQDMKRREQALAKHGSLHAALKELVR